MMKALLLVVPPIVGALRWSSDEVVRIDDVSYSRTFYSEDLALRPGEFMFTDFSTTPAGFPTDIGPYAITGFKGYLVYADTNETVPLDEVYDHHWVVAPDDFENYLCPSGPQYVFGIGAESRRTYVTFPKGYGYRVMDPSIYWGANIHLLRTEHLAGEPFKAAKECNECYYAPGKGCLPQDNGTFTCCGDYGASARPLVGEFGTEKPLAALKERLGEKEVLLNEEDRIEESLLRDLDFKAKDYFGCPVKMDAPSFPKHYRLMYTLNYTEPFAVKDTKVGAWTTPDCEAFYDVQENNETPEHLSSTTFPVEEDQEIVVAIGHQHVGGLNISLYVNDQFVCSSHPVYGSEPGVAGNEKGYLVEMTTCFQKGQDPMRPDLIVKQGDTVRLDSWYWVGKEDKRLGGHPAGSHLNVMGYMYAITAALD